MAGDFLQSSIEHHNNGAFRIMGLFPIVSTVSEYARFIEATARVIVNVGRVIFYAIGGLGQLAFRKRATYLEDSLDALYATAYNVSMMAYAIFAAIPIIGNIYPWVSYYIQPFSLDIRYC